MYWTDNYIEIPFKCDGEMRETGVDCWKLVCLIYRERLGIILPTFTGIFLDHSPETLKEVSRTMKEEKQKWIKVEKPAIYDVVLLRTGIMSNHVGLVLDSRRMIHIMDGIDSCIEEYTGLQWKNRIEGFYRYRVKVNGE
jgi:cell wall-associated NlpC family hydrolase